MMPKTDVCATTDGLLMVLISSAAPALESASSSGGGSAACLWFDPFSSCTLLSGAPLHVTVWAVAAGRDIPRTSCEPHGSITAALGRACPGLQPFAVGGTSYCG